ncbi:MAG: Hpt domain-containing protein [Elainellaceae cyanobacterium]
MIIEDEELRNLYQEASQSQLKALRAGLTPSSPPLEAELLETLRREAHSLKGDSKVIGLEAIADLAEQAEQVIKHLQAQDAIWTPSLSDGLTQTLEAIDQLTQSAIAGTPVDVDAEQVAHHLKDALSAAIAARLTADQFDVQPEPDFQLNTAIQPITAAAESDAVQSAPFVIEDEEMRDIYQATSAARLQAIRDSLEQLTEDSQAKAALKTLKHEAHSFKGDALAVGFDAVASFMRQLNTIAENLLERTVELTPPLRDRIDKGLKSVEKLVHEAVTSEPSHVNLQTLAYLLAEFDMQGAGHGVADEAGPLYTMGTTVPEATVPEATVPEAGIPDTGVPEAITPEAAAPSAIAPDLVALVEDEELREVYRETSEERLQHLESGLLLLEREPENEAVLTDLLRETHSLKGDARAADVRPIEAISHVFEDVLGTIQRQERELTPQLSDRLYESIDAMGKLLHSATAGAPHDVDVAQILQGLTSAIKSSAIKSTSESPSVDIPPVDAPGLESELAPEAGPNLSAELDELFEDKELLDIYQTSSAERLQRLETGLVQLENRPDDSTVLAELLREAHSLKSDSSSVGLQSAEMLTHAIEDILSGYQRQEIGLTTEMTDNLYIGLDAIGQLIRKATVGEPVKIDIDQIFQRLRATASADTPVKPAAVPSEPSPSSAVSTATPTVPDNASKKGGTSQIDTVRIQTRELDLLLSQAEELAVTRIQIAQTSSQTQQLMTLWEEWQTNKHKPQSLELSALSYEERLESLLLALRSTTQENSAKLELVSENLRERIRRLQLIPISVLFRSLPRTVRDLAKQQSKAVNLVLEGEDARADKRLLEGIKDSLMHIVRNAIDHGIETPEVREASGKPATATLRIKAYQTALSFWIEITDDGQGLDIDQIKRTAISRGLHRAKELEAMSTSQIHNLILAPGFSTRSFITEISGRGVGLDVVRAQVEQLKGVINIESTPGEGCTFRLQLSTALSTENVVLTEAQGMTFALPIEFLQMTLLISPREVVATDGRDTILIDGETIPIANLVDILEVANSPIYRQVAKPSTMSGDRRPCVLLKVGDEQAGFFVDRLINQQEVISKPLSPLLKRVRNVSAATILGTGEICMILNPPDLIRSLQQTKSEDIVRVEKPERLQKPVILLVEDSPTVRIQERRLFEGAGYEVVTATNGLEGYDKFETRKFDAVVSDVEMPLLDGFSLTAQIRQQVSRDSLPIILVTTLDSEADRQRGASAGANAYILKGKFNQEALLETLERLV